MKPFCILWRFSKNLQDFSCPKKSADFFQLVDIGKFDKSRIERDFVKIHHQHGAQMDEESQTNNFFFEENLILIQKGNAYLELEKRVRKANDKYSVVANDNTDEVIRLVKNALAFTIQDTRNSTSSGTEIEKNKYVGPDSTKMSFFKHREGDISTNFDIIVGSEDGIYNLS